MILELKGYKFRADKIQKMPKMIRGAWDFEHHFINEEEIECWLEYGWGRALYFKFRGNKYRLPLISKSSCFDGIPSLLQIIENRGGSKFKLIKG